MSEQTNHFSFYHPFCRQLLAMHPSSVLASFQMVLKKHELSAPMNQRPEKDAFGNSIQQLSLDRGVAVVPIKGTMLKGADALDKQVGFVSHEDIMADLQEADSRADRVILDIDSPGGTAMGTPEVANMVQRIAQQKPVVAFTSGMMASAAHFVAAAAMPIAVTQSSIVGSIGTRLVHVDISRMLQNLGIEVQQFTSGKFKGMGQAGVPLTDAQSELYQDTVEALADEFKNHELDNRPQTNLEAMEGQVFVQGKEAVANGLADVVVDSFQDVLDMVA